MNPAVIVFAALFTGATSLAIGLLILQGMRIRLRRDEALPLAYVVGSGGLSLIVFAMLTFWIAQPRWFAAVGGVAIAAALWRRAWRVGGDEPLTPLPRMWKWLFASLVCAYGIYTFAHALAPDISPDGITYHLGTVHRWYRAGGLVWHTTDMYANMPMAIETLFLFAFSFGRHSAAALVHWQFYLVLPFLLLNIGRRFGQPVAGAVAGLLVFLSPVAAVDGASSYVDMATAAILVAMFSLLLLFEREREPRLVILIGALGGFAYASKMTAFPALPFAALYVGWILYRHRISMWRPLATLLIAGGVFIVPWLTKSALMVGNPFSPFLNRYFPNPYVRISFEEGYRASMRSYDGEIQSWKEIPREVTVKGAKLQGLLGPVFLLAPIGLMALRWPLGRRALLATLFFIAAYPSNIGTRFLLLPLPFLSLAMGLTVAHWRGTAALLVLFHALMSWPSVMRGYADQWAWGLEEFRWREALRIVPEETFFMRAPTVRMARLIEQKVPPHGRVLGLGSVAEAYTSRDVLNVYQAGLNNILGDIMTAGFSPDQQGSARWLFRFPPVTVRRVRVVQTRSIPYNWSVSEVRLFGGGGDELARNRAWRIRAHPNPWDVQLAFDNCAITRWSTWQAARPGDHLEVFMSTPFEVSAVQVEAAPDQVEARVRVEGELQPGSWTTLSDKPESVTSAPVVNSRLAAKDDLKRFGVTHLAIADTDYIAQDLSRNQVAWGIAVVGEVAGIRLYRLD